MPPPTPNHPTTPDWLSLPTDPLIHEDRRTRLFSTHHNNQRFLVKHFKSTPLLQRLRAALSRHPAQREALWQARLAELNLPATQPVHHHTSPAGKHALIYPDLGPTLTAWWQRQRPTDDRQHRRALAQQLGQLLARFAAAHIAWPNAAANDFFVAPDHTLQFINAGSCRGASGIPLLARLLPLMQQLLADLRDAAEHHPQPQLARPTRTDRLRVYRAMLQTFPEPLDGMQHLPTHADFK